MNFIKLMFISISLLFTGCGNSDSNSSTSKKEIPINNVSEAKRGLNSFSGFQSLDISKENVQNTNNFFSKMQKGSVKNILSIYDYIKLPIINMKLPQKIFKLKKSGERACRNGGTFDYYISDAKNDMDLTFKDCKVGTTVTNGEISLRSSKSKITLIYRNYVVTDRVGERKVNYKMDIEILENSATLLSNGTVKLINSKNETFTKVIDNISWKLSTLNNDMFWTFNGKVSFDSKCFTGTYNVQTVEDITVRNYKSNSSISSGILKVNTATYTYEDPYVTIETEGETKIILQSEVKREKSPDYTCSE